MEKLRIYLNSKTPQEQKDFAEACKTSVGYLRKAISESSLLNPLTCVLIELKSSGEVTRKDLRPDDWPEIWPELVASNHRHISDRRANRRKPRITP